VRTCEICSAPVQGRRATTCSDRCRAERWRRGQEQVRPSRDARVLRLLREAIRLVEERRDDGLVPSDLAGQGSDRTPRRGAA